MDNQTLTSLNKYYYFKSTQEKAYEVEYNKIKNAVMKKDNLSHSEKLAEVARELKKIKKVCPSCKEQGATMTFKSETADGVRVLSYKCDGKNKCHDEITIDLVEHVDEKIVSKNVEYENYVDDVARYKYDLLFDYTSEKKFDVEEFERHKKDYVNAVAIRNDVVHNSAYKDSLQKLYNKLQNAQVDDVRRVYDIESKITMTKHPVLQIHSSDSKLMYDETSATPYTFDNLLVKKSLN